MAEISHETSNPYFYIGSFKSVSPREISSHDNLDSNSCNDLIGNTTSPFTTKKNEVVALTLIASHTRVLTSRTGADIDSEEYESSVSSDSVTTDTSASLDSSSVTSSNLCSYFLPQMLLQDIRERNGRFNNKEITITDPDMFRECHDEVNGEGIETTYSNDTCYVFHINEKNITNVRPAGDEETFAGYKDILGDGSITIRSAKGTVRGVKNRVRAGIATFLQINNNGKNYKEKELGKVVVYTTTMGILRETYQACLKVRKILQTLLVKYEERDVFMSSEYQAEIRERMHCDQVLVPQVFVNGQHIGDCETVERLNETGELRRILKAFRSMDVCTTCQICGGYRLLPCQICKGSKKSVHRNHFTTEFVALKCMNCDEVGLVRCRSCS